MLISTLNCEMWPNFSYRGVKSVQLLLLLLLLMVFSSENFGFSPPYAGIAGIGPERLPVDSWLTGYNRFNRLTDDFHFNDDFTHCCCCWSQESARKKALNERFS